MEEQKNIDFLEQGDSQACNRSFCLEDSSFLCNTPREEKKPDPIDICLPTTEKLYIDQRKTEQDPDLYGILNGLFKRNQIGNTTIVFKTPYKNKLFEPKEIELEKALKKIKYYWRGTNLNKHYIFSKLVKKDGDKEYDKTTKSYVFKDDLSRKCINTSSKFKCF